MTSLLDALYAQVPPPDARIAYGADPRQFGDLRLPSAATHGPGPYPVVIVIHGGYWRAQYGLEYFGQACAALATRGLSTWNIEYRRIGDPGGGWPNTLLDVAAAADYLPTLAAQYPLDLGRIVALGHSAGGQLALWLAARPRIPAGSPLVPAATVTPLLLLGVVSLAGVVDLRRAWELRLSGNVVESLLGGAPLAVPDRYAAASPYELAPLGPHIRQILLHGADDENVPVSQSEEYVAHAQALGDDARLILLPDTGHFELVAPSMPQWQTVQTAVMGGLGDAGSQP
ncbi:MAG: alpha/beta fold hydrolase [Ktedonobacterales bacterium]